jgi:hypothetical protein
MVYTRVAKFFKKKLEIESMSTDVGHMQLYVYTLYGVHTPMYEGSFYKY